MALYIVMRDTEARLYNNTIIENRFVFAKEINNIAKINDDEGWQLAFHRMENGNNVVFTKDLEGVDVAIEHCADGGKVFHLSQDSKGLPAMHEFKPDGTEFMYLLDKDKQLEKMIETKTNGDKVTTWFYTGELISQEQRQSGGIVFKINNNSGEALIWLRVDGSVDASGSPALLERLQNIFMNFLDGVEI